MGPNLIERSPSAYSYPLLIKHLLHTALSTLPSRKSFTVRQRATRTAPFMNVSADWQTA